MPKEITNVDQLRHEIDSGRLGDKIDFPDPAAAPLGTDAEAGGNPVKPAELAIEQKARALSPKPRRASDQDPGLLIYLAMLVPVMAFILLIVVFTPNAV